MFWHLLLNFYKNFIIIMNWLFQYSQKEFVSTSNVHPSVDESFSKSVPSFPIECSFTTKTATTETTTKSFLCE